MTYLQENILNILTDDNKVVVSNNKALIFVIPNEYTRVNYIASTGTQYINTQVIPTSDTLIFEWEGRDDDASGNTSLFASEYAVGGVYSNRDFGGVVHGNNTARRIYVGKTTGLTVGYASTDGLFHKWSLNIMSDHSIYLVKDGTKLTTYSWTGSVNRYNSLALFCNHTTNSFSQKACVAYKYFKIKNEGGLLFWGIPVKRKTDSVLGMYDLVKKQFFPNNGTGSFVEG